VGFEILFLDRVNITCVCGGGLGGLDIFGCSPKSGHVAGAFGVSKPEENTSEGAVFDISCCMAEGSVGNATHISCGRSNGWYLRG
jgi:hypothetical protein